MDARIKLHIKLRKGELTKHGYRVSAIAKARKMALDSAVMEYNPLSVLRKIVVLRTFFKHDPKKFERLDKDVKYIQGKYFKGSLLEKALKASHGEILVHGGSIFDTIVKKVIPAVIKYGEGEGEGGVYLHQKHRTRKGLIGVLAPTALTPVAVPMNNIGMSVPMNVRRIVVRPPIKPYGKRVGLTGHSIKGRKNKNVAGGSFFDDFATGVKKAPKRLYKRRVKAGEGGLYLGQKGAPRKGLLGATYISA